MRKTDLRGWEGHVLKKYEQKLSGSAFESHHSLTMIFVGFFFFFSNTFNSVFINNEKQEILGMVSVLCLTQEHELPDHFTENCLLLPFHRLQSFRNDLLFCVGCYFQICLSRSVPDSTGKFSNDL